MRAVRAILLLTLVASGVLLLVVERVRAGATPTPNKFIGTLLGTIDFDDGQNQFSFPAIGQIHGDGTVTVTDGDDYLPGNLSVIDGVAHGSWRMISPETLRAVTLYHAFDANGVIAYTGRLDFELTLAEDDDLQSVGSGVARIYFPGMDPLDQDSGIVVGTLDVATRAVDP